MAAPELPKNRLATTDETGKRVFLYPAAVRGRYFSRKKGVHAAMILFFLLFPWVRFHGQQLLFLDVARREFHIFGLHMRAHDAPLLVFLFLGFAFGIGFLTAVWGRLWCGWACPQTVFTESIFRRIEAWIEGNHLERRALDQAAWTAGKALRKGAKWAAFTLVSLVITHSFLAYFVGSRELLDMIVSPPTDNWASFLVILATTAVILLDFGWFREQFCVIMCPYGRFQSVMLDSQSLVVGYDEKRGEPRRGVTPITGTPAGDCVDCRRCITVCPTGIDIRRGLQMECVACTACVDACDEVMVKVKKPIGLIRYTTLAELSGRPKVRVTMRAVIYATLCLTVFSVLALSLRAKDYLEVAVLRAQGSPYELMPDGANQVVVNHFRLEISNQTGASQVLALSLPEESKALGINLIMPMNPLPLGDNAAQRADFFVRFPQSALSHGAHKVSLHWEAGATKRDLEVTLVGPGA